MSTPIRLILVDDHPVLLQALEFIFSDDDDFAIAASCSDGESALNNIRQNPPDIMVLDMNLPGMDGIEILRRLRHEGLNIPTVIYTADPLDDDVLIALLQLGVRAVVLKNMAPELLLKAVKTVHEGGEWLEKQSFSRVLNKLLTESTVCDTSRTKKQLTERELQLTRLVAQGLSNAAIADTLKITEGTVKVHIHRIYTKLDVTSRVGLVMLAKEKQWL